MHCMVKIGAQAMLVLHQDEFPNSIGHVLIKPPLSDYQSSKPKLVIGLVTGLSKLYTSNVHKRRKTSRVFKS